MAQNHKYWTPNEDQTLNGSPVRLIYYTLHSKQHLLEKKKTKLFHMQ